MVNFWLAFEAGLTVIPVINKIDLSSSDVPRVWLLFFFFLLVPSHTVQGVLILISLETESLTG